MSDGEVMMTVLALQKRLDLAEQQIAKLEADEWYKAGLAVRGMLVVAYQLVLAFWVALAVGGVLVVAWLIGEAIKAL